jgi:molybdate transport repressor ModE-like protein/molybdopterin-binding protein
MNRFDAVVESVSAADSVVWLRLRKGRMAARLWGAVRRRDRVPVEIRPEEVLLCAEHPGLVSARNVLPGHVRGVRAVPEGVYVTIDARPPLVAMVTRSAVRDLGLVRGRPVYAVVKASSVRVRAAAEAPLLTSVVGRHGVLTPALLGTLRAIRDRGSLTAAAEAEGVTYRTAWLRAGRANRAWGAPLVERRRGGRGGGGAILTPQGEAVLKLAARGEELATAPAATRRR